MLKKGAFALIATIVLSGMSAFAFNPVHINEVNQAERTGWSASGDASYNVNEDGTLNLAFGENGGSIVREVGADLNVFAKLAFKVYSSAGTFTMDMVNSNGETVYSFPFAENGAINSSISSSDSWKNLNLSMRLGIGDYSGALNGNNIGMDKDLSASGDIAYVEFNATAAAEMDIFQLYVSNVKRISVDRTNMTTAVDSGLFSSKDPYNMTTSELNRWDTQINFPAITDYGVIEFDLWIAGDGYAFPNFDFGQGGGNGGGMVTYSNTPMYNTSNMGWQDCSLRWDNNSDCVIRLEIDVTNQVWYIYAMDKNSNGELKYAAYFPMVDVEYVDYFNIKSSHGAHFFGVDVKVWSNGEMVLDSESVTAYQPYEDNSTLVVATYSGEELIDVKLVNMAEPCVKTFEELGLVTDGARKVKAFMLNDTTTIVPLGEVLEERLSN